MTGFPSNGQDNLVDKVSIDWVRIIWSTGFPSAGKDTLVDRGYHRLGQDNGIGFALGRVIL